MGMDEGLWRLGHCQGSDILGMIIQVFNSISSIKYCMLLLHLANILLKSFIPLRVFQTGLLSTENINSTRS